MLSRLDRLSDENRQIFDIAFQRTNVSTIFRISPTIPGLVGAVAIAIVDIIFCFLHLFGLVFWLLSSSSLPSFEKLMFMRHNHIFTWYHVDTLVLPATDPSLCFGCLIFFLFRFRTFLSLRALEHHTFECVFVFVRERFVFIWYMVPVGAEFLVILFILNNIFVHLFFSFCSYRVLVYFISIVFCWCWCYSLALALLLYLTNESGRCRLRAPLCVSYIQMSAE